jgi:polyisoprenoid-binding protein YceI
MFLATLLFLSTPEAEATDYVADVAHSILEFEVDSLLGPVHGTFKDWNAAVSVENNNLGTLTGSITVNVATIDTRIAKRDKHLRTEDFFHVELHPNATFTITKTLIPAQAGKLVIQGDLRIHGVVVPLSINFDIVNHTESRIRLQGETRISRSAFGIDYQSRMNPIQDDVVLKFNLNLVPPEE